MIAVKAVYEQGGIRLLEPVPLRANSSAVVLFLDAPAETSVEPDQSEADDLEDEINAYRLLHTSLVGQYLGQHVAIHSGALVDHDADFVALHKRIRERFGRKPVLLRRVEVEPERVLVFRSPRLRSARP
jgi:hypothetical protein